MKKLLKIVKETVNQGIKPYIVISKFGFSFKEVDKLGLKKGDFFWTFTKSPDMIKPIKDAITIFDLRKLK